MRFADRTHCHAAWVRGMTGARAATRSPLRVRVWRRVRDPQRVLQLLGDCGMGMEAASHGELAQAIRAGVPADVSAGTLGSLSRVLTSCSRLVVGSA